MSMLSKPWIKTKLVSVAVLVLLFGGIYPSRVNAVSDYSKCPDTWRLSATNQVELDRELQEAKSILGTNLATSLVSREILDGDIWRSFANNPMETTLLPLLRLPMRSTFKIEVKGCAAPLLHTITFGFGELKFIESNYQNFFSDINKVLPPAEGFKFSDFKQEENALSGLKKGVEKNRTDLSKVKGSGAIFWYNDGKKERVIYARQLNPIRNGLMAASGPGVILQMVPERLNCIALSSGIKTNNARNLKFDRSIWVIGGTSCKYQVVAWLFGNERYPHTVFVLDNVAIETPKSPIYCQNLKNAANIFPLKAGISKCPSGSKRVS